MEGGANIKTTLTATGTQYENVRYGVRVQGNDNRVEGALGPDNFANFWSGQRKCF